MFKNISTKLAVAMALSLSAGLAQAAIVQLAVNGGFETGNTGGWTSFPSGSSTFIVDNAAPRSGVYSGYLTNLQSGSAAIVQQANVGVGIVTPGQEITIDFWARGYGLAGGVHFAELFSEIDGGGTSSSVILGGGPLFPSDTTWNKYSYVMNAGPDVSGGITLQFNAATGANIGSETYFEIDDISITVDTPAVPVPAAAWLFGSGLLGLIGIARRKTAA